MTNRPSAQARLAAALIALIALGALILQVPALMRTLNASFAAVLWDMPRYFTNLTNALVALTLAGHASGLYRPGPIWPAALTASAILVGVVYYVRLAPLWDPQGLHFWTDHILHAVVPLAMAAWWLIWAPKQALSLWHLPAFAIWPALYAGYVLVWGAVDGLYPYPFLDPVALGLGTFARNLVSLFAALIATGALMIGLARVLGR